ncbi:hypothetical protein Tco_0015670 [Tanacetum coccineum]
MLGFRASILSKVNVIVSTASTNAKEDLFIGTSQVVSEPGGSSSRIYTRANLCASDIYLRLDKLFIDGILYVFQEETNDAAKEWEEGEPDLRRISDKLVTEKASLNAMEGRRIEISDSFVTDKSVAMHRNSTTSLLAAWLLIKGAYDGYYCSLDVSTASVKSNEYEFDVTWIVQDIRHKFGGFYFFIKSLYSVFFINDHYIEPTEFEIQEMVNTLVSRED